MKDGRRTRGLAWAQEQRESWAVVLADSDRKLLALRDSGKTFQQMATQLGISAQAARYRTHAAQRREALRRAL